MLSSQGTDRGDAFLRLGRLHLCGALYMAYRTYTGVEGQYTICMLFDTQLLLARVCDNVGYEVVLAIELGAASMGESDHGKGK